MCLRLEFFYLTGISPGEIKIDGKQAVDSIKGEVKITEPLGGDMLVDTSVG